MTSFIGKLAIGVAAYFISIAIGVYLYSFHWIIGMAFAACAGIVVTGYLLDGIDTEFK